MPQKGFPGWQQLSRRSMFSRQTGMFEGIKSDVEVHKLHKLLTARPLKKPKLGEPRQDGWRLQLFYIKGGHRTTQPANTECGICSCLSEANPTASSSWETKQFHSGGEDKVPLLLSAQGYWPSRCSHRSWDPEVKHSHWRVCKDAHCHRNRVISRQWRIHLQSERK